MLPLVLLIDDSEDDIAITQQAMRGGHPCRVEVLRSAAEVQAYIGCTGRFAGRSADDVPSLVLLDVNLFGVSGFDVLRAIRTDPHLQFVPVLMRSDSAAPADVRKAYALGASGYVRKGVDMEAIRTRIAAMFAFWLELNVPACEDSSQ